MTNATKIAVAICKYVSSAKFPDVEDKDNYNIIYARLTEWRQEDIINNMTTKLIKTGANFYVLHKLSKLLISRNCIALIRYFIIQNIFIMPAIYAQKYGLFVQIAQIMIEENPSELLNLNYLRYSHDYFSCMQLLDVYTKQYSLLELSNFVKDDPELFIIKEAIMTHPMWSAFDSSIRAVWIKALLKWKN